MDFRNALVVMTCNLGGEAISREGLTLGFSDGASPRETELRRELETGFSREFLGRLDAIVPFRRPDGAAKQAIAEKLLGDFCRRVSREGRSLRAEPGVAEYLCGRWSGDGYGVRSLGRLINRELGDPLAELLSRGAWAGEARAQAGPEGIRIEV